MDQKKFEQLKSRYQTALKAIEQQGVRLENLHEENGKLVVKGVAPSQDAKNRVWDQIKMVNPNYDDITADIRVEAAAQGQAERMAPGRQTYTVKAGDTLSKISKQFYGNANDYMKIFEANRDKLSDPDKIQAGQELVIPEKAA
jgi:nucleoid-associated protein YgaU